MRTFIYTDGACSGNPGPGGWGAIVLKPDQTVTELGGREVRTTNNQMELTGTIEALRHIHDIAGPVTIYTDSVYVIRGITQWLWGWIRRGWKTAEGKDVINQELWQALAREVARRERLGSMDWKYTRGHVGIPGNERCDAIAVAFTKGQPVRLFKGPVTAYGVDILAPPPDEPLPEMTAQKKGDKKEAYSYLSLVGTIPMRHATWSECERRVKGQSGAKFKKTSSEADEMAVLKSWGIDPKNLK